MMLFRIFAFCIFFAVSLAASADRYGINEDSGDCGGLCQSVMLMLLGALLYGFWRGK